MAAKHKKMYKHHPRSNGQSCTIKELLHIVQRGRCLYCLQCVPIEEATIDHVVPKSCGGSNRLTNRVMACNSCNNLKGSIILSDELIQEQIRILNGDSL